MFTHSSVRIYEKETFTYYNKMENKVEDPDESPIKESPKKEAQVAGKKVNAKEAAKLIATPAVFKRRQATKHLEVQSPTDHIFSPISQKLLAKKRNDIHHEYQEF